MNLINKMVGGLMLTTLLALGYCAPVHALTVKQCKDLADLSRVVVEGRDKGIPQKTAEQWVLQTRGVTTREVETALDVINLFYTKPSMQSITPAEAWNSLMMRCLERVGR